METALAERRQDPSYANGKSLYAPPQTVTDVRDCYFYHTMDLPGYGTLVGDWDLRAGIDRYLGGVAVHGKRVLELGTASGGLCFAMEQRGADMVAFDLAADHLWDFIPLPRHPNLAEY